MSTIKELNARIGDTVGVEVPLKSGVIFSRTIAAFLHGGVWLAPPIRVEGVTVGVLKDNDVTPYTDDVSGGGQAVSFLPYQYSGFSQSGTLDSQPDASGYNGA